MTHDPRGRPRPEVALTFAGFDPTGGAGVLADCRAFEAMGLASAAVVTALTVQDGRRVIRVQGGLFPLVSESAAALAGLNVAAIKVGMLADARTADAGPSGPLPRTWQLDA